MRGGSAVKSNRRGAEAQRVKAYALFAFLLLCAGCEDEKRKAARLEAMAGIERSLGLIEKEQSAPTPMPSQPTNTAPAVITPERFAARLMEREREMFDVGVAAAFMVMRNSTKSEWNGAELMEASWKFYTNFITGTNESPRNVPVK
jgi:hypothetical protein